MGSAMYYGKLEFGTPGEAESALPGVTAFLKEMHDAYTEWQLVRGEGHDKVAHTLTDGQITYLTLRKQFRRLFDDLGLPQDPPRNDPSLNCLAGQLDSPYEQDGWGIKKDGNLIRFCGEVWHFADWEDLGKALVKRFGAKEFDYVSDEYASEEDTEQLAKEMA